MIKRCFPGAENHAGDICSRPCDVLVNWYTDGPVPYVVITRNPWQWSECVALIGFASADQLHAVGAPGA